MSADGAAGRHRLGLVEAGRHVVLDGGIGTEILRRGTSWASHRIQDEPNLVRAIHADYIAAGADVITTNTFQLSQRSFHNHFNDDEHRRAVGAPELEGHAAELIAAAVGLASEARRAAGRPEVSIAGSMTTLEWCFRPDLTPEVEAMRREYREMVAIYQRAGADLILFETFNKVAEARVALEAAAELEMPAWIGFVSDAGGRLLSGETMGEVAAGLVDLPCEAALVNCCPVAHATAGLEALAAVWPGPTGAFAHVGKFYPPVWQFTDECPPGAYLEVAERWSELGARVVGGCCGTTPEYVELLAGRFGSEAA